MTIILTNAPDVYDYGYTTELARGLTVEQYEGQRCPAVNVRRVEIPIEHVDYQCGRYFSGLYLVIDEDEMGEARVLPADAHEYEPGDDHHAMHTDPSCRACGAPRKSSAHV